MKAVLISSVVASLFAAVSGQPAPTALSGPATAPASPANSGMPSWIAAAAIPASGHPYDGAVIVSNPDFAAKIAGSVTILQQQNDSFAPTLAKVGQFSTFTWVVDSTSVDKTVSSALKNARKNNPKNGLAPLVQFVLYDLPDRDCSAGASSGEFTSANSGLQKYKSDFIDRIARWIDAYPDVRVVISLEPDAIPNLVTNGNLPLCQQARDTYIGGLQYAVSQLSQFPNVAVYVDAGNSGWLGWGSNQGPAAQLLSQVLAGVPGNATTAVRGVSINVSNYGPNLIPGITDFSDPALKNLQWNPGWDNIHFAKTFGQQLANYGVPNHFLVDTARNGVYPIPNHTDNWCNIFGAGLGERPGRANVTDAPLIDAFGWVKTPGESDGTSDPSSPRFVGNCAASDSMTPAPEAGMWFHDYIVMLSKNANPSL